MYRPPGLLSRSKGAYGIHQACPSEAILKTYNRTGNPSPLPPKSRHSPSTICQQVRLPGHKARPTLLTGREMLHVRPLFTDCEHPPVPPLPHRGPRAEFERALEIGVQHRRAPPPLPGGKCPTSCRFVGYYCMSTVESISELSPR